MILFFDQQSKYVLWTPVSQFEACFISITITVINLGILIIINQLNPDSKIEGSGVAI